jgi:preprotein translocase subunit YajC
MFLILIGVMLFSMMSGRKDKRKREDMLSSLGKQDKIQTVGGIIATVADVKGDEVLIRVEEGSNVRIRISRSAVQQVLRRGKQKESSSDALSEPEMVSK